MKSKVLICALAVLLVIGMVSCSMDDVVGFMERTGKNLYGIKPSMEEVDSTTAKIDGSVKKDESGNVTIDTTTAGDLISGLAEIKNSTQKTNAMKEELSKKVSENKEESDAVKAAMQKEIENVVKDMPASSTLPSDIDPAVKDAYDSVKDALEKIQDKVSGTDDPTKADLATVAIVKSLAETVTEVANKGDVTKEELIKKADNALQALDALKVAADAAGLGDILGDISISSLLSSQKSDASEAGKAVASKVSDDKIEELSVSVVEKVAALISNDGILNQGKYNRTLVQFSAIRTAYEAAALFAMPEIEMPEDGKGFDYVDSTFSNGSVNLGGNRQFSFNDALLYVVSFTFTEADRLCSKLNESFGAILDEYMKAVASGDETAIEAANKKFSGLFDRLSEVASDEAYGFESRTVIGVNTLALILSSCECIDTVKNSMDKTIGNSLNDFVGDLKGGNK